LLDRAWGTYEAWGLRTCNFSETSCLPYSATKKPRENPNDAHMAKMLTEDEARRIASNIAKLPTLLGKGT
jgi:hypothetical protein